MATARIKHLNNSSASNVMLIKTLFLAGAACGLLFIPTPARSGGLPSPPSTLEPTTVEELEEVDNYFRAGEDFYVRVSNPLRITLLKAAGLPADNLPHPGEYELLKTFYPETYAAAEKAAGALFPPPTAFDDDGDKDETS